MCIVVVPDEMDPSAYKDTTERMCLIRQPHVLKKTSGCLIVDLPQAEATTARALLWNRLSKKVRPAEVRYRASVGSSTGLPTATNMRERNFATVPISPNSGWRRYNQPD